MQIEISAIKDADRKLVRTILEAHWGSADIVTRGNIHHADQLDGYFAYHDDEVWGLVTLHIVNKECEMVSLNALEPGIGIGTALTRAVIKHAQQSGCTRVWLITTNDNTPAMAFYQKQGFRIIKVHVDAIRESRRLKPELPEYGMDSIPIRDEIELDLRLG